MIFGTKSRLFAGLFTKNIDFEIESSEIVSPGYDMLFQFQITST